MGRRKLFLGLGLAVALLALAPVLLGGGEDHLSISQKVHGQTTVAVITGPTDLLDRVATYTDYLGRRQDCHAPFSFGGPGFWINWGDGVGYGMQATEPILGANGCPDPLQHPYTVPGTYRVKVGLYHPGPDDAPIVEWSAEMEVAIQGKKVPLDLALLAPSGGATYLFQAHIPVAWTIAADGPVDLILDVVGEDGMVMESKRFEGLSFVGRGEGHVTLGSQSYEHAIANGPATARVRATIVSAGRAVLVRESDPLTLSAEYVASVGHRPEAELLPNQPLAVMLKHHTFNSECYGYIVDWGDGSTPDRVAAAAKQWCALDGVWIETLHTYLAAGVYRIVLRSNNHRIHQQPEASPYYEVVTATVP